MNDSRDDQEITDETYPIANVSSSAARWAWWRERGTRLWWLTVGCLVLAVIIVAASLPARGPLITIHFLLGRGIKPGDTLRHRGIEVGEVTEVRLRDDVDGVSIRVRLKKDAASLAREGSQYWIARPRVSLARVSDLETVVGAKFLGVLPGPSDAPAANEFQGREAPLTLMDADSVDITIRFSQGYGLSAGDPIRFRGIVVGEVIEAELGEDLNSVDVHARLAGSGTKLARVGSQFWVERPQVDVSEIRGLDTLLGGRYIGAVPGPADAEPLTRFEGLSVAPAGNLAEGGLRILLEEKRQTGLVRGAPILYRGSKIGHVMSAGLAADAATIQGWVYIRPGYTNLVRSETRFWAKSGFDISLGITGLTLDADSLASIALGGIELATPDPPGDGVATGHRFVVAAEPDDEWFEWQPRIAIGANDLPEGASLPRLVAASLRWQESQLGFHRDRERHGWVLHLEGNKLLGPSDLLRVVADTVGDTRLDVAGKSHVVSADAVKPYGSVSVFRLPEGSDGIDETWPTDRLRVATKPENCLLVSGTPGESIPLAATRFTASDSRWRVDPALSLDPALQGACVVAVSDGRVVGVLVFEEGPHVALVGSAL